MEPCADVFDSRDGPGLMHGIRALGDDGDVLPPRPTASVNRLRGSANQIAGGYFGDRNITGKTAISPDGRPWHGCQPSKATWVPGCETHEEAEVSLQGERCEADGGG